MVGERAAQPLAAACQPELTHPADIPAFATYRDVGCPMAKNTSVGLGDHFEGFITHQIKAGR